MVEAQTKNQSMFWLWSDEIDFQKRGDAIYWSPELVALEKHKNSILDLFALLKSNGIYFTKYII